MKSNTKRPPDPPIINPQGGFSSRIKAEDQLRRSVLAHLLWEDNFYEDGQKVVDRIKSLVPLVPGAIVRDIAIEARKSHGLRHVPLLLAREMCRYKTHTPYVYDTLTEVIQRADEPAEFLALYWENGKEPIANQAKMALAESFYRFKPYHFSKYQGVGNKVSLRDVMFQTNPRPRTPGEQELFHQIANQTLPPAKTWEVELSKDDDRSKKEKWTDLLANNQLGALALIRNLRNMTQVGVSSDLIRVAIARMNASVVWPFQFMQAAKHNPGFDAELDEAMLRSVRDLPKFSGNTLIVVDVSGSMMGQLSLKSDLTRLDAACAMAALLREVSTNVSVFATAGSDARGVHATHMVPARHGFALMEQIRDSIRSLGGGGIFLTQALNYIDQRSTEAYDRVIVITDEVDCDTNELRAPDRAPLLGKKGNYILNVGAEANGIAYKRFQHITGFSEAIVHYLAYVEDLQAKGVLSKLN